MSARPKLELASSSGELHFGPRGELRESFAKSGRVHIDRWLPFLVLHRSDDGEDSISRRVALNSPAYLFWSSSDDAEAEAALDLIVDRLKDELGPVLLIELTDAPAEQHRKDSPKLPALDVGIAASADAGAKAAAEAFAASVAKVRIDSHHAEPRMDSLKPPAIAAEGARRLAITVPQIHRAPDGRVYPQLTHELVAQLVDCILCAAAAFIGATEKAPPPHFRSLGRSAFIAAALNADKKLDALARSYDFLLSISPINTAEARERFFEGGEQTVPEFRYRPLAVDPDSVKRDLYAIDLSVVEDLLLEQLLAQKRREIDMQLTMLATRNTSSFKPASVFLYGNVSDDLLASAHTILERVEPKGPGGASHNARQVASAARELVAHYRSVDPRFEASVEVRDDVSGLLVSGGRLMISSNSSIAADRLDPLLAHEVSVHLLTYFNGATQGLTIFRTGLAGYEGIQEGLGVFAEWAVGGLTPGRLRLLAGRVIAVDAMIHGGSFIEVYWQLRDDFGLSRHSAFDITARVFRSGGLAKDAIYLKGFLAVIARVAAGDSLEPFWLGKIAPTDVDAVDELLQRKLLHPPLFVPEFLSRRDAQDRIATLRGDGSLERLLDME
ncbi:MAG TPA: tyrosine/phenylalanine carboxypeptidase domain-containing protein [Sphingomicrobium sp.]|nr:tyrosine/phenylalanine carboxypeptidase domain-containing protein [Sphingomicrobium sp.]